MDFLSIRRIEAQNKAFLHALKLKYPYQTQIDEIGVKFGNDWQQACKSLFKDFSVEKEIEKLEKLSIKTLYIEQPEYPKLLRQIKAAPTLLYYKGTLPKDHLNLAFVGSRKISSYGIQATEYLINGLRGQKINIISGLAYGTDTCAHIAALESGLPTIAVLGSGLDDASIYPRQNLNLARRIIDSGGTLFSEFPPGTKAQAKHFPFRNRIVAGLSRGVVIIQAGSESGALITAQIARSEKRNVFAVPGDIFEKLSFGTNQLIKNGASLVTSANDLCSFYGIEPLAQEAALKYPDLTENEKKVLAAIRKNGASNEQISAATKLEITDINYALTTLEIKNIIRIGSNNLYRLNLTSGNNAG